MKIFSSLKVWFIVFLYLLSITGCTQYENKDKKITVVFRFDDPSALSSLDIENKVIESFREHNASVTFGIIPYKCKNTRDPLPQELIPLGKEKADIFRNAAKEGIVDLALHGYSHQMSAKNSWTEFSGVAYEEQIERLSKGKKYLEKIIGMPIQTFIPPYNTYDLNTLKALDTLRFKILSAGIHGAVSSESPLSFLPMTIRLHQVKLAVEQARKSSDSEPIIVVMFHEYDFLDVKVEGINKRLITIEDLNILLAWLNEQKDVNMMSLSKAYKDISDLTSKRFAYVKNYDSIHLIIPGFLRKSNSVYPEVSSIFSTYVKTVLIYGFICLFAALIALKVGCRYLSRLVEKKYLTIMYISIVVIITIIHLVMGVTIHAKLLGMYLILVGFALGLNICFLFKTKHQ